jgi:CheY-like chemotaxis protein
MEDPLNRLISSSAIKVLLVEDRPEDAALIERELRQGGLAVASRRVDTASTYEEALANFAPDLILSDYTLPGFDGSEALRIACEQRPDTPFIFVSGTIGEERAIETLRLGAVDYVLKDNRARLVPAVERALKDAQDREAKRWAVRKLEESEERFRYAMHYSSIGMALVDPTDVGSESTPRCARSSDSARRNCWPATCCRSPIRTIGSPTALRSARYSCAKSRRTAPTSVSCARTDASY